jgi:multidrug resistance efflux pump
MPQTSYTLRDDLRVTARSVGAESLSYLIKDPKSEEIYECGEKEYFICRQLNGVSAFDDLQLAFQQHYGIHLPLEHLKAFTRKLQSVGLLESTTDEIDKAAPLISANKLRTLGSPDRLLGFMADWLNWCFSRYFLVAIIIFSALSLGVLLNHWGDIIYQLRLLKFSWGPIIYLIIPALAIFVIETLGEFAKGIACKFYGGRVHEFGVMLNFKIIPKFYTDVSDALWMQSKDNRLRVFSAGLICRLLLWGISVLAWKHAKAWSSLEIFWLFFLTASTFSFFFTLIPLIERDGYQLLTIWLRIENLRDRAIDLTKAWLLRRPMPEALSSREIRGFKWYGMLCLCFQLIFWGLLLSFTGYFLMTSLKGIGAVIFICLLLCRFGHVVKRMLLQNRMMKKLLMNHSPAFIRLRVLVRLGLLIVLIIMALLPYPFTVGGEFRLLPVNQIGIRAQVSGEIDTVFVSEGQWVKKNDPIAKLNGRDQKKRVEAIKAALDETQARLELLQAGPKPEAIDRAEQEVKAAAKSLEYSKIDAERARKMFKDKAISEKDYDNALRKRDLDRERLVLAEKNLELVKSGAREEEIRAVGAEIQRLRVESSHAEEELELTTLTSPADGRIITPYLSQKIGQVLGTGELFAVVEDANTIIAEIDVLEEDIGEVRIGSRVKLKTWVYPNTAFWGKVVAIAPVAYEKKQGRVERTLTEREWMFGRNELLREEGKVVRVLTELTNTEDLLKTDMTGYAKIDCETKPVVVAFTRWLVRFILIEVWSWIP